VLQLSYETLQNEKQESERVSNEARAELQQRIAALEVELKSGAEERSQLHTSLTDAESALEASRTSRAREVRQRARLTTRCHRAGRQVADLEAEKESVTAKISALHGTVAEMKDGLASKAAEFDAASATLSQLRAEMDGIQGRLEQASAQAEVLRARAPCCDGCSLPAMRAALERRGASSAGRAGVERLSRRVPHHRS
jgi:chromosome segregation ATPase